MLPSPSGEEKDACERAYCRQADLRALFMTNPSSITGDNAEEKPWPAMALARSYCDALKRHFGDRLISVVLYGSTARREHTRTSDIDVLIVAKDLPPSHRERNRTLVAIENELVPMMDSLYDKGIQTGFSTKIKTPEEAGRFTPLYLDLTQDAVILYDRDGFFSHVLEKLRSKLKALGARRVQLGKVRYWHLKPDYKWGEEIEI